MSVDRKTLDLLVCPICKGKLHYRRGDNELICGADRLAFPVRDDIPVMLVDEAREISLEEKDRLK